MNYKSILAVLLIFTMLVVPVAAFWEWPDKLPTVFKPCFGVSIEGYGEEFDFEELEYGRCKNFTVLVHIFNVTDLFGYEFDLKWDHDYFKMVEYNYMKYADAMWGEHNWFAVLPNATQQALQKGASPYRQAISSLTEGIGVEENYVVANLTFHFVKDVCWCQDPVEGKFEIENEEMWDSAEKPIIRDPTLNIDWTYTPVQPEIYLDPDEVVNCKLPGSFIVTVKVANITKMKSLHFRLMWKEHRITRFSGDKKWLPLLSVNTTTGLEVNEEVFFEPNFTCTNATARIKVSGVWYDYLDFTVDMNASCTTPLVRGDFWVLKINFTKEDPWDGFRQPEYNYDKTAKGYEPENATTPIWFKYGYFDVMCPTMDYITFGEHGGICKDYGAESAPPSPEQPEFTPNFWVHSSYDGTPPTLKYIQWAIDWADPGDVIKVYPGTYTENIVIDKPLILMGSGSGSDPSSNTVIKSAAANTPVIKLNADDVIVKDLRVTGATGSGNDGAGIITKDGVTSINNATFYDVASVGNEGYGIAFDVTGPVSNITLIDCVLSENLHGFRLPSTATASDITVNNCVFDNNTGGGIMSYADLDGLTVIGGTFTNNGFGIMLGAETYTSTLRYIKNVDVTESTFNNNSGLGFWVYVYGYRYHEIENINVDDCSFTNHNNYGVGFYAMQHATYYEDVVINATLNWWGDRRGPGGNAIFPESTGDNVTDQVLYDPWISCCLALYDESEYTFDPIAGDLDGDGEVDLTDLLIIATWYSHTMDDTQSYNSTDPIKYSPNLIACYYDLNQLGAIDIGDVVIVAKNYGEKCTE